MLHDAFQAGQASEMQRKRPHHGLAWAPTEQLRLQRSLRKPGRNSVVQVLEWFETGVAHSSVGFFLAVDPLELRR